MHNDGNYLKDRPRPQTMVFPHILCNANGSSS